MPRVQTSRSMAACTWGDSAFMLTAAELQAIAQQIKTAQDQGLRLTQITAQHAGFDTVAAYAVADLIHAMRLAEGARAVGREIGFVNSDMRAQFLSAPVRGHVYDITLTYLPDTSNTPAPFRCASDARAG